MGLEVWRRLSAGFRLLLRPVQAALGKQYCCAEACLEGLYWCSMSSCNKHDLPGGSAGLCP